ncbi:MAG: cupin domain-containing protein [Lysobacterales bacterium]
MTRDPGQVLAPTQIAAALEELWSPRVVAELDDNYVKVAKVQGTLGWHAHTDEDELFYVLRGQFRIEMEAQTVDLGPGQMYVVPKGVRHNPVAEEECLIMLIERKSTRHTGDEQNEFTRSLEQQLRPL